MSAVAAGQQPPYSIFGTGWKAAVDAGSATLAVAPEGDILPGALDELFAPTQQCFWTLVWLREDGDGWDVYLLRRGGVHAV